MGIGNLGADPEVRSLANGDKVANLRMAMTERYKDAQGAQQEKTTWVRIAVFGPQASFVEQAKKGWRCVVVGKLQERSYTDAQGAQKTTTEIVVNNFGQTRIEVMPPLGRAPAQQEYQPQQQAAPRAYQPRLAVPQANQRRAPVTTQADQDDPSDDLPWN